MLRIRPLHKPTVVTDIERNQSLPEHDSTALHPRRTRLAGERIVHSIENAMDIAIGAEPWSEEEAA